MPRPAPAGGSGEMSQDVLIGLAAIVVLGIAAQWVAWRVRLPSILLLLFAGIVAGPATGLLDPDAIFGDLLLPLVSISVAVILFDGGLGLRVRDLRSVGAVVRNLVTIGALVTLGVLALAARYVLGLDWFLAALLGAILVVTGPTVVTPILNHVRPVGQVGPTLRWEGIVIDPIGAVMAVLAFEVALAGEFNGVMPLLTGLLRTLAVGGMIGLVGAVILVVFLERFWIPDYLQSPVSLMLVVAVAALSSALQAESGLVAVTVMGVALANQTRTPVRHIVEFKENLGILLLGMLFVLLAARLTTSDLSRMGLTGVLFLLVVVLVARPLAVWLSTLGSKFKRPEKLFMAAMAPRGIVAASVSAVFALRLEEAGKADAERIVSVTFLVIVGTVLLYGLSAEPLARRLGLANRGRLGVLIAGAHGWARQIAEALRNEGFSVRLVDTNRLHIYEARLAGFDTTYGSILSDTVAERTDLTGFGCLLALTSNDEVNALAALRYREVFGRAGVFQLVKCTPEKGFRDLPPRHLGGRILFGEEATCLYLSGRFAGGSIVKTTRLTEEFDYAAFRRLHGGRALLMFAITESGQLQVSTQDSPLSPRPGQKIVCLFPSPVGGGA
jgi:NhaP-type Na+/H+ or K+/H+ antiporter